MKRIKEIVSLILLIVVLSGCNITINFNFDESGIKSTVVSRFTLDDYNDFANMDEDEEIRKEDLYDSLIENKKAVAFNAFEDGDEEYQEDYFKEEDGYYLSSYSYKYNYDNFTNNYFFKHCFTNFEFSENDELYIYKITGDYVCEFPVDNIKISSKNGIDDSNSVDIKDDVHSWYVFDEENDISFSIRKNKIDDESSSSSLRIIAFIIILLMIVSLFVIDFISKRQSD